MKRQVALATGILLPATMAATLLVGAQAAQAGTCTALSGGSQASFIKANNENTDIATGYNCAYVWSTGDVLVGAGQTVSPMSTSEKTYQRLTDCTWTSSSSGMTSSSSYMDGTGKGNSVEQWIVGNTSSSTRHWTGAVLWMMSKNSTTPYAGQYTQSCGASAGNTIPMNSFFENSSRISSPSSMQANKGYNISTEIYTPDYKGADCNATATLYRQLGSTQNPATDTKVGTASVGCDQNSNYSYAGVAGNFNVNPTLLYSTVTGYNWKAMTPPSVGFPPTTTPTFSMPVTGGTPAVAVVSARVKAARSLDRYRASKSTVPFAVEERGKGKLAVRCPVGSVMLSVFAGSPSEVITPEDLLPTDGNTGISLNGNGDREAMLQVVCRATNAPMEIDGRTGRGSARADVMKTTAPNSQFFGGMGDDRLVGTQSKARLDGGFGDDVLILKRNGGSANGSFGNDTLTAKGTGSLLVGGPGTDTFTTGSGEILVNARDGKGGDVVHCGSAKTTVMKDKGDVLDGPCTIA